MSDLVTLDVEATAPLKTLPRELQLIQRYKNSPWLFMTECCNTMDEVDRKNPIKKYPAREYNKIFVEYLQQYRLLALVKHRRMMATWTVCCFALHEILFSEGARIALVSKKEMDSDDLVKRCKFVFENIPESVWPSNLRPKVRYKFCTFENLDMPGSVIMGFPQGADQLRQYTFRRIFADEFAFWEQAEESWVSMKPTLDGGGSVCLFSTRFPGFFQHIVEDTIDDR